MKNAVVTGRVLLAASATWIRASASAASDSPANTATDAR